ncbi:hypothetical protein DFP94_11136 [Fontibacillus phaseoli]|uniref:ABC-2 family transporter n=1 Tax=Fontibacillus phaseoli TaxID=1416533 RepID=A0A369B5A2_9BACL|nr:hypothetical protein [Fontibacillus phaseoli]RCX16689.1 hypothetical protein DFP94_11136 [Fontibacillus phaseoli]
MMKLIAYEMLKILRKRLLWVLLFVLVLSNGWMYYQQQMKGQDYLIGHMERYYELEREFSRMPNEKAYAQVNQLNQELISFGQLLYAQLRPDNPELRQSSEQIQRDSPEIVKKFEESPYREDADRLRRDTFLVDLLLRQYKSLDAYRDYINGIQEKADEMLSVSIFYEKDSFSYRNIMKTPTDFDHLKSIPLDIGLENGIVTVTQYKPSDLMTGIMIFLLCVYLFVQERERGLLRIIRTNRKGRLPTALAKVIALIGMTVLIAALFYGTILFIAGRIYGFGDLSRYIQSMPTFKYANMQLSVLQYLMAFVGLKMLAAVLLSLVLAVLFIAIRHVGKAYVVVGLCLGCGYIAYKSIHPLSPLGLLKYINLFAYFDTFGLLGLYQNLNLLGYPVNRFWLSLASLTSFVVILLLLALALYIRQDAADSGFWLARYWTKWKEQVAGARGTSRLFIHETLKALFTGKGYLALAAALVFSVYMIDPSEVRFGQDDHYYNSYIRELSGPLDQEKAAYIEQEKARHDDMGSVRLQNEVAFQNGEITLEQYNQKSSELDELNLKKIAFNKIYQQYSHLVQLQESRDITGSFLNELTSEELFDNRFRDSIVGIVYMVLLTLLLSPLFPNEYRTGMIAVVRSTRKGRWKLFVYKHLIGYLLAIVVLLALIIPRYINLDGYSQLLWHAPVQSLQRFANVEINMSLLGFVLLTNVLLLWGSVIIVHFVLMISVLLKRQSLTLFAATALTAIPVFIQGVGVEGIRTLSFNNILFLNMQFSESGPMISVLLYYSVITVIGLLAGWITWQCYNGKSLALGVKSNEPFRQSGQQAL